MIRLFLIAAALFAFAAATVRAADDAAAVREREFKEHIQPLLKQYCIECHGGKKTEAELSLAGFQHALEIQKKPTVWRKVIDQVADHNMPPKEATKHPTAEERQRLTKWVEGMLKFVDCSKPQIPYATIRRLTRTEYRNTVRDLLGVDYTPAADFPADDVGYGFDGIGDVLTLPPILLEKYLAAGEAVSQQAIKPPPPDLNMKKRSYAGSMKVAGSDTRLEGSTRWLTSEGEVYDDFDFPADGSYRFKAKAFAEQAGPETAKMDLVLGGRVLKSFEVKAEAGKPESYYYEGKVTKGRHKAGLAYVNDYFNPTADKEKDRDRNLAVLYLEVSGPTNQPAFTPSEAQKRIVTVLPTDGRSKLDAAREVLRPMVSRAYRRRVTEEDLEKLLRIANLAYQNGEPFEMGLQLAFQALLASPQFIYKVELNDGADANGIRTLNEYELATRLSYFLWASMPDDELYRLATANKLREGDNLERQVRRMLADSKAKALSENFAAQWLQLRNLERITPDRKQFPQFDDALRTAMRRETELFFESVVKEDRSVIDLLGGEYTFVNERLAAHYGIPNVSGNDFQRVSLKGTPRGGLLTQASVLTVTSNPSRTSPVKRGRWVLDNLLADPPPPPAPDVPPLPDDEQAELKGTLRQRTEQHRSDPRCASCHVRMDPLGFALENFDAVGRWRDKDGKEPIDARGELPGGVKFNGPQELRQLLLRDRRTDFVRCVTEKLLTYGLGRGLELGDRCAVDKILTASSPENYSFSRLVIEIVRSDPFQKRAVR